MNHFKIVCLITFMALFVSATQKRLLLSAPIKRYPSWLLNYQEDIKDSFKKRELANILFATLFGKKEGITGHSKTALKRVNLIFLLSPGSYHLAALLMALKSLFKFKGLWRQALYLFLSFFNYKFEFLFLRRFSTLFQAWIKVTISPELIFYLVFVFLYLKQNFYTNPVALIFTFGLAGTFLSLRHSSKKELIIGIFIILLVINLFLKQKLSFLSIPLGMILGFSYLGIFLSTVLFYLMFWVVPVNWIEPIIYHFMMLCKVLSKTINGSFTCSSIFLIFAMFIMLSQQKSKKHYLFFTLFLFLHTDIAAAPAILRY